MIMGMKIPTREIKSAVDIVRKTGDEYAKLQVERAKLGTEEETRAKLGENGVTERKKALKDIDTRWAAILEEAQKGLDGAYSDAMRAIDEQVMPNGADIIGDNAGDFALLEHNLVTDADQLKRIIERHDSSPAFRIAAERYAGAHGWEGFSFVSKENSVRSYTNQVFDALRVAAKYPGQYAYEQYVNTPG